MDFDWACYLALADEMMATAEKLKNDGGQQCRREACLRSAISRFYYGVFCVAKNLLEEYIGQVPKKDTHQFVICEYKEAPDEEVKKVGKHLDRLWGKRKQADYDDEMTNEGKILDVNDIAEVAKKASIQAQNSMKQIKQLKSIAPLSSSFDRARCEK